MKIGTDYYGGDFRRDLVNSPEECQFLCNNESLCKHWVSTTGKFWPNAGQCHLKKNIYKLEMCINCISGFRESNKSNCKINGKLHSKR